MTIALAAAWHPRGEQDRLRRFYPQLQALYDKLIIAVPPDADAEAVAVMRALPGLTFLEGGDWRSGRHLVLRAGIESGVDYIQYIDGDRLARWIELRPDELRQAVERIQTVDCLILGRTETANATHPQALQRTEIICNTVFSNLIGRQFDFSAGSRGFSRAAAEFILRNSLPERPMGADSEWAVLLHRGGFSMEMMSVDGLDWETADRYLPQAADAKTQRRGAEKYDADPEHWAFRAKVAQEIIEAGLDALNRPLNGMP
jgi:hypothetical protein